LAGQGLTDIVVFLTKYKRSACEKKNISLLRLFQ